MNLIFLQQQKDVYAVIQDLMRRGHIVLRTEVNIFELRPIIEVKASELCVELNGEPLVEVQENGSRVLYHRTTIANCRILWRAN